MKIIAIEHDTSKDGASNTESIEYCCRVNKTNRYGKFQVFQRESYVKNKYKEQKNKQ